MRAPWHDDAVPVDRMPVEPLRSVIATRYVVPLREGGSLPGVMEAEDLGTYVVKFYGAGQGRKVLVAEVLVGELARALGLPVPELVLVEVDPVLGRAEPALYHGRRCLELLEASGDGEDWDVPFAHEALARAYFLAGDGAAAQQHLGLARELGAAIADAGDRDHLERELADLAAPY